MVHAQFEATALVRASILFKKFELVLKVTDDVWYAKDLPVNPVTERWLDASTPPTCPRELSKNRDVRT